MFDHVRDSPRAKSGLHPAAFAAATALMLVVIGGFIYGSVLLLALLGLDIRPPVVEVTYDPFGDGRTLEDAQREWEAEKTEAEKTEAAASPEAGATEGDEDADVVGVTEKQALEMEGTE